MNEGSITEGPRLHFGESPDSKVSVMFTFRLDMLERGSAVSLPGLKEKFKDDERYKMPSSFFHDIVHPSMSRAGVPVILRVPSGKPEEMPVEVDVRLPSPLVFECEGVKRRWEPGVPDKKWHFKLCESLAIFDNGIVLANFALMAAEQIDEAVLISILKLVNPSEKTDDYREDVKFWTEKMGSDGLTLIDLASNRIETMFKTSMADLAGALEWHAAKGRTAIMKHDGWNHLVSAGVQIDDKRILDLCQRKTDDRKPLQAMSGILQIVLDYREQDEGEIDDSLEPLSKGDRFAFFSHPKVLFEVTSGSRSFCSMAEKLASCPYFLLVHSVIVFNEAILARAEDLLGSIEKGETDKLVVRQFQDLFEMLEHRLARYQLQKSIVSKQIGIFRDLMIRWIPNVFRYKTEREVYDRVVEYRGLDARLGSFKETFERYATLVEGLHETGQAELSRRIANVLTAIGLFATAVELPKFLQMWEPGWESIAFDRFIAVGFTVGALGFVLNALLTGGIASGLNKDKGGSHSEMKGGR